MRRQVVPAGSRLRGVKTVIGKQLGRYLVLTPLGSGGMGDVYVAHDTTLNRKVALKLPRREVTASVDRLVLFRREARAAAALNHPNIVHLYTVEEADGLIFMTMELVVGRSLRDILSEGAPLPLPKTLMFASQIAEGLACAHAAGVLHRDLKPENVMITAEDRVKILDFGVAKFFTHGPVLDAEPATTAREISTSGMTVGTVGYMSPEQALGKVLDARTDLFALGVMLFEMATGSVPFDGATPAAVFDQLLNRNPPSPLTFDPLLPVSLVTVIEKALEKDPENRYGSASEILAAVRRIDPSRSDPLVRGSASAATQAAPPTTGSAATRRSSIVVLPFVDMTPSRDQEYFCHGITEEIISSLTRIPGLHVVSRTSAFAFQGKNLEITEIARRLRVGTALEGSVRKAGDRVRVTAQLVDAATGYQLWSKRFDRELSDIFAIQDEIAASVTGEFRMRVVGQPGMRPALNAAAHDTYLKGTYQLHKWTEHSVRRAIGHFRDAIAEDGRFAPAYAALAEAHIWLYSGAGICPARETIPHARWGVEKALELDATLADAHKVRGLIAMNHDWSRTEAEEAMTRALELGPGSAAAHLWNAWRLAVLERRHDGALAELEEAERLDPLDLQIKTQIGYVHHFRHDVDRAIVQFEKVLALDPSFAFAHYALGDACTVRGEYERAFDEFNRAIQLGGRSANHVGVLGYAYARAGRVALAKQHLQELTTRAAHDHVSPIWMAMVHLGLGELDDLFDWLERAYEERDGSLILIATAVEFDPVRDDTRFASLLEKMGLGHLNRARTANPT